jgi:hypothetical protein
MVLHVCIPVCQRKILLKKVLTALRGNTKTYSTILIYVYDNNSYIDDKRMLFYNDLIHYKMIDRLVIDTPASIQAFIPKVEIHYRFASEMVFRGNKDDHYLFLDSDIILDYGWDKLFNEALSHKNEQTRFIMKRRRELYTGDAITCDSEYMNSALFFMDYELLKKYCTLLDEMKLDVFGPNIAADDIVISQYLRSRGEKNFNLRVEPTDGSVLAVHVGVHSKQYSLMESVKRDGHRSIGSKQLEQVSSDEEALYSYSTDDLLFEFQYEKGF